MSLASNSVDNYRRTNPVMMFFASFVSACIIGSSVGLFTVSFVRLVSNAEFWRVSGRLDLEAASFLLFGYQTVLLCAGMSVLIIIRSLFKIKHVGNYNHGKAMSSVFLIYLWMIILTHMFAGFEQERMRHIGHFLHILFFSILAKESFNLIRLFKKNY